ncbi:hypothetical protein [Candidatus Poriferisodalis sp.]|uniref:hypothetical protein n=1 Tax=Candidatus Poriferisodalis sp. TaxID=3101277 RepID=UPI003C703B8B
MKRSLAGALILLAVAVVAAVAVWFIVFADAGDSNQMSYIVVPHPDDEMQAWSLIEDTTGNYKVFIMATRGEQTFYCGSPGYDEGTGEIAPDPWPAGKWTPSCESARKNSFFGFMEHMAAGDSGLPSSYTYEGVKGPFDTLGTEICRYDDADDNGACVPDLTAEVWTSPMGAVVWFNLGDGDLTLDEVVWAVTTVRDNRRSLGINDSLENHNLIGASYWNGTYSGCSDYAHSDHLAIRDALWHTDFDMGYQAVPTCRFDPAVSRSQQVSYDRFHEAFEASRTTRIGAHPVHYGWMLGGEPGYWPGAYEGQDIEFHRNQHFWIRFE